MHDKLMKMLGDKKAMSAGGEMDAKALRDVLMELKKVAMMLMKTDLGDKLPAGEPDMVAMELSVGKDEAPVMDAEGEDKPEVEMAEMESSESEMPEEGDDMDRLKALLKGKKAGDSKLA